MPGKFVQTKDGLEWMSESTHPHNHVDSITCKACKMTYVIQAKPTGCQNCILIAKKRIKYSLK